MNVQEEILFMVSEDHAKIMKGKRTKRQRLPSPIRLALAMPHSSSSISHNATTSSSSSSTIELEDQDMANCLILLAQGTPTPPPPSSSSNYLHRCKTCNKCFPSFQALGGHRTSHKKHKPNETVTTTFLNNNQKDHYAPTTTTTILSLQIPNSKVHECSICGAQFSSGQALGGHMRRHRNFVTTTTATTTDGANIIGPQSQEAQKPRNVFKLDLNLPAPEDDSKFSFQPRENVIVFSSSSLVDCHY
jgi:hypothetical protein